MKQKRKSLLAMLLTFCLLLGTLSGGFTTAASQQLLSGAATQLTHLTVNYQEAPLGIAIDNLRFGWQMQSNVIGMEQASYQITVADETGTVIWDSGVVNSGLSASIPYGGDTSALIPEARYTWTVTVTDRFGQEYSSSSSFETGTDWDGAQWITSQGWAVKDFEYETQSFQTLWGEKTFELPIAGSNAPLFRTEKVLTGDDVASARLYITSLGTYEAYINGRPVQEDVNSIMNPGWTDYSRYVNYQTYDVTDYIVGDTVALSAVVSSGWYGDVIGNEADYESAIGNPELRERALYAKLSITYADGSQQDIVTDGSWKATDDSFIEKSGIYYNLDYNNQRAAELKGWTESGFDAEQWEPAACLGQANCDVRPSSSATIYEHETHPFASASVYTMDADQMIVERTYQGGEAIELKKGQTLLLNFAQNASHIPHFIVSGETGTRLFMQPGEILDENGTLDPSNTCELRNFQYTLSGEGREEILNEQSFVGYQYLEVTASSDVTFYRFDSIAVTSLQTETGSIETSNDLINRFVQNSKWSQMSNFCSIPTDCPHREYLGWSGDVQIFAETAMYHFDSAQMLENYMEIMSEFYDRYGYYADVMPYAPYYTAFRDLSCGWGDAAIITPYYYYLQTGDASPIRKYWDQMSESVNGVYSRTVMEEDHFKHGYQGFPYGDWSGIQFSGVNFISACFTIYNNQLMAKMAEIIGEDGSQFAEQAETLRQYIINRFIDREGNVLCATLDEGSTWIGKPVDNAQTAVAWAIKLKLYHTQQQKQHQEEILKAFTVNKDSEYCPGYGENTIRSGFLGVNILMPSLSEGGQVETAWDLMNSTNVGSWLYAVTQGATTTWESWTGGNSYNHYAYGAGCEWLYEYAAGIQKDEESPAFKHFILQPEPDDSVSYLNGSYDSYYGKIISNWTANEGAMTTYEAVVPANTTATLYLPVEATDVILNTTGAKYIGDDIHNGLVCAKFELAAGGYDFTIDNGVVTVNLKKGYVDNNAPVKSANAPDSVQVNEDFTITVVTSMDVTDIKIFNENDMALGRKIVGVTDNADGTKTWAVTVSMGTVGNDRTLKIITKDASGVLTDSGVAVTIDILSMPVTLTSFDVPESAVANRKFIVTAITDLSATKIEVFNENGMKIGLRSLSSKVVDGQKVWTGVMSIGTQGERFFSCYAVNKYGTRSEALTDNISVKAFA